MTAEQRAEHARIQKELAELEDRYPLFKARADRKRKWLAAALYLGGLFVLSALMVAAFGGCAHVPAEGPRIVLSERLGSTAAAVIEQAVGQSPKAATYAGVTIVFQPADARDPCLQAHEAVHAADQARMGIVDWTVAYVSQLGGCERDRPRAECLRTIPLEARAYEAQHACMRGGPGVPRVNGVVTRE